MTTRSKLECTSCKTEDASVECINCDGPFCTDCDEKYHKDSTYPNRQKHIRKAIISSFAQCNCCGSENVAYYCITCKEQQLFCKSCDALFHSRQQRQGHIRKQFREATSLIVDDGIHCCHCHIICTVECNYCSKSFCRECDGKYHDHSILKKHTRKDLKRVCTMCDEVYATMRCNECNGWYCNTCDEVRHRLERGNHQRETIQISNTKEETISRFEQQLEKCRAELEEQKYEKASLKIENRELQNKISRFRILLIDKETILPKLEEVPGIWKKFSDGNFPTDAVVSCDYKGMYWYVSRIEVDGDVVPGDLNPSEKVCFVLHNGIIHRKSPYEVLASSSNFEWIPCHGDEIPPHAVSGGRIKSGEVLYVGRVKRPNGLYDAGKVQQSKKGCYNHPLVDGDYTMHNDYEILVWK